MSSDCVVDVDDTVVLTNDDGHQSALFNYFSKYMRQNWSQYNVLSITPMENMSAISHAISIKGSIEITELKKNSFAVKGYPADCVIIAHQVLLKYKRIGLVISGPNLGTNLGQDVLYSGTIAASREAALIGIPTISISVDAYAFDASLEEKLNVFFDANLMYLAEKAYEHRGAIVSVNICKEISTDIIEAPLSTRHYYPYSFSHRDNKRIVFMQAQGLDMSRCMADTDWYFIERAQSVYTIFEALPRVHTRLYSHNQKEQKE